MKRTMGIVAFLAMTLLAGSVYAGGMGNGRGSGMGGWTSTDASSSVCPGYGNAAYGERGQGRRMAAWNNNQAARGRQGMGGWMQAGPANQGGGQGRMGPGMGQGMGQRMGRW